jgi:hypothetical protein
MEFNGWLVKAELTLVLEGVSGGGEKVGLATGLALKE